MGRDPDHCPVLICSGRLILFPRKLLASINLNAPWGLLLVNRYFQPLGFSPVLIRSLSLRFACLFNTLPSLTSLSLFSSSSIFSSTTLSVFRHFHFFFPILFAAPRAPCKMDTDWCLRCGRHTNEGNDVYCSKQCMALDQSLAHSLPARTSYHRHASFDLPTAATSPRPASVTQSSQRLPLIHRRAHPSDPTQCVARFRDEELQDLHAGAYHVVPSQYLGKDHEGILRWAASVHPGLEEDEDDDLIPSPSSSIPVDLDKLIRPPFLPLTAQNLAPPYVTRHTSGYILHDFPYSQQQQQQHREPRTAPSLIPSQDDASFLTPASESVNTPSVIPDASSTTSSHAAKPLLRRFVNKISSWMAYPVPVPLPNVDAGRNTSVPPSPEERLVYSDQTLRTLPRKDISAVSIPKSLIPS